MAILENWEQVSDAQEVAANSAGTSEQKYSIYLDSMQAHLNELKTVWSEFLLNLSSGDGINNAIDILAGLVQILDILINKTPMGTIVITALTAALIKMAAVSLGNLGTQIASVVSNITAMGGSVSGISGSFNVLKTFLFGASTAATQAGTAAVTAGAEVAAAGAEAATGGALAASGAVGFSSLAAAIGAVLLPLAAIGVAIYALPKIFDTLYTSADEMRESIQETEEAIAKSESTISDYNSQLDENKSHINEINGLKGTSDWNSSLAEEANSLERQNSLLERKIQLEERQLEIEKEQKKEENEALFEKEYKTTKNTPKAETSEQYKNDYDTGNSVLDYYTVTQNDSENLSGNERMKQLVANQATYLTAYRKNMDLFNETGSEAAKAQAESFEKMAGENETEIESIITDLETFKDELDDPADLKMIDEMIATLETAGTTTGKTVGEILNGFGNAEASLEEKASGLAEQFKAISGMEIKPKDADSMDEWLASLSETDLSKVQDVLLNCGDYADDLSSTLGKMNGADAAQTLCNIYNDFYGILNDCIEAYDEFDAALNKDYNEESTKYAEMLDYALQSSDPSKGVENWEAYKASLRGLGLNSEATRQDILNLQKALKDYIGFDTDGNLYVDMDKFRNKIFELVNANDELGEVNTETGEISIENFKKLANEMGIPEEAFHALLESAKALFNITEKTQFSALQNALSDVSDKATEVKNNVNTILHGLIDKSSIDESGNITYKLKESLDYGTDSAKEAKANLAKTFKEQQAKLEQAANEAGFTMKVPVNLDYEHPENNTAEEYSQMATWIQNTSNSYQQLIDDNFNFDTSKITSIAEKVNEALGEGEGEVTVDGSNITFTTDEAKQKFVDSIENTFKGLDVGSIINNAIASGMTFTSGSETGASAFSGVTDSLGQSLDESIEKATSGKEIQMKVAIEDNASESLTTITGNVDDMKAALENAANVSLAGTTSNITYCGQEAGTAYTSVTNLSNALNNLPENKSVTLTYTYQQNGSLSSLLSAKVPSANGRDMPAYAEGKAPKMGVPIRAASNSNSLVGEEGKERVITASGKQYDVGVHGAEFVHLNKGDTVLPANVTKMLDDGKLEQHNGDEGLRYSGSSGISGTFNGGGGRQTISFTSRYSGSSSSSSSSSSSGSVGSSSGSSSSGSSSSDSNSSSSDTNEAAENELKTLEHQRAMEYITEKQYAQKYEAIWKKYYKDKSEYQDKDYEMQEKLHDLQKTFFEDRISMLDEENEKLQRSAGTEQQQIANYLEMQQLYHERAEQYRRQGFTDDSPEIRELSSEWWDLYDKINELRSNMFDNYINDLDHTIDLVESRLDRIDDYVIKVTKDSAMTFDELEKDLAEYTDKKISMYKKEAVAINAKIVAVNVELNRLYKEGYEQNKENIQELEKQAEELQNDLHNIVEQIREEKLSQIEKELDYQERLRSAVKQYAQDRVDELQAEIDKLEEENDELDKQKEKKELLEALDSAKQKNKRVYYADKGKRNQPLINYIG